MATLRYLDCPDLEGTCKNMCSKLLRKIDKICDLSQLNIEVDDSLGLDQHLSVLKRGLEYIWIKNCNKTKKNNEFQISKILHFNIGQMVRQINESTNVIRKTDLFQSSYSSCLVLLYFMGEEDYILKSLFPLFCQSLTCREDIFGVTCFIFRMITSKCVIKLYTRKTIELWVLLISSIPSKIPEIKPGRTYEFEEMETAIKNKLGQCKQVSINFVRMIIANCSLNNNTVTTFLEEMLEILISMLNTVHVAVAYFILIATLDTYIRKILDKNENAGGAMKCFFLENVYQLITRLKFVSEDTHRLLANRMDLAFQEYKSLDSYKINKIDFLQCAAYHFSSRTKDTFLNAGGFVLMFFYLQFSIDRNPNHDESVFFISKFMKNQNRLKNISYGIKDNHQALQYLVLYNQNNVQLIDKSFKCMLSTICNGSVVNVRVKAVKFFFRLIQSLQINFLETDENMQILKSVLSDKSALIRESILNEIVRVNRLEFFPSLYDEFVRLTSDEIKSVRRSACTALQQYYESITDETRRTEILVIMCRCLSDVQLDIQLLVKDYLYKNLFYNDGTNESSRIYYKLAVNHFINFQAWFSLVLDSADISNPNSQISQVLSNLMDNLLNDLDINNLHGTHLKLIHMVSAKQPNFLTAAPVKLITVATNLVTKSHEESGKEIFNTLFGILENLAVAAATIYKADFLKLEQHILESLPNIECAKLNSLFSYLTKTMNSEAGYFVIAQYYKSCWGYLVNETNRIRTEKEVSSSEKNKIYRNVYFLSQLISKFDFRNGNNFPGFIAANPKLYKYFENMLFYWLEESKSFPNILVSCVRLYCIANTVTLQDERIRSLYIAILSNEPEHIDLKIQVISVLTEILHKENVITKPVAPPNKRLKLMDDERIGTKIVHQYLKFVLNCYAHSNLSLRRSVFRFIMTIYEQGLINPVQTLPYIIAMTTDDAEISTISKFVLKTIAENYPTMIRSAIQDGFRITFNVQCQIQNDSSYPFASACVKTSDDKQLPTSLNGYLFSLVVVKKLTKQFLDLLIKCFEKELTNLQSVQTQIFIAENCAYFDYNIDDVFYLLVGITNFIVISRSDLDQRYKEFSTDDETRDSNVKVIDKDKLLAYKYRAINYRLMTELKNYLMRSYSISDKMLSDYVENKTFKRQQKRKAFKFDLTGVVDLITDDCEEGEMNVENVLNKIYATVVRDDLEENVGEE